VVENLEEGFDIEPFFGEIKNHPEVRNIAAETYHDRQNKRGAWIKIRRIFREVFDEKDEKERNEMCKYYFIPQFFLRYPIPSFFFKIYFVCTKYAKTIFFFLYTSIFTTRIRYGRVMVKKYLLESGF